MASRFPTLPQRLREALVAVKRDMAYLFERDDPSTENTDAKAYQLVVRTLAAAPTPEQP